MKSQFKNKTAVITGAASGIGQALAFELAKLDCHLALCDIDEKSLSLTRRKIKSLNPNLNVLSSAFDIRDSEAFASFRDLVKESFNGLNYLFNNAGFTIIDSAVSDNINEMRKVMDVNYWGVVQGSILFLPLMKEDEQSHIVNMSSIYGITSFPTQSAYCASKHAIKAYTECLAMENKGRKNLSVHCVHPGGVSTNILANADVNDYSSTYDSKEDLTKAFENIVWLNPQQAAKIILKGVAKNKFRIHVGIFAIGIDLLKRVFPNKYMSFFCNWIKLEAAVMKLRRKSFTKISTTSTEESF